MVTGWLLAVALASAPGLEARVVRYTVFNGLGVAVSGVITQTWEFPLGG